MSKAHKHSKLISEWASNPSGYVIWMAYGTGVDFTWVEAPTPCDWNENVQYKLVPLVKKEKRWIGYCANRNQTFPHPQKSKELAWDYAARHYAYHTSEWQMIEIEVEV